MLAGKSIQSKPHGYKAAHTVKANAREIPVNKRSWLSVDVLTFLEVVAFGLSTILIYSFNADTQGIGNVLTNGAIILFITVEFTACVSRDKIKAPITGVLFLAFLIFCLLSILWSVAPDRSVTRVRTLAILMLYYFALLNFLLAWPHDRQRLYVVLRIIVIAAFIAAIYTLLVGNWETGDRVDDVIGDSNQASAYLAYSIPPALYLGSKRLFPRWFAGVHVLVIISAVLVMASRTGLVVGLLGILLFFLITTQQRGIISLKTLMILALFVTGVLLIFNVIMSNPVLYQVVGSRFGSIFDILNGNQSRTNEGSYYDRGKLLELARQLFVSRPFAGVGINGFSYYASLTIRDAFSHNDYMELLSTVGIIGFALYYSQHVVIASRFRRLRKGELALAVTLLIQLLLFHFFVVFYYQKLEFMFLAVMFALTVVFADDADCKETHFCPPQESQ